MLQNDLGTSENHVPFPEQTKRLNDYTCLSLQALAFPTLFSFGEGDVSNRDRHSDVTITNSNRHLLKDTACNNAKRTHVCPFAAHDI